jgi:hypothetical protein
VVQALTGLRRKLALVMGQDEALVCRRGVGYAIVPRDDCVDVLDRKILIKT